MDEIALSDMQNRKLSLLVRNAKVVSIFLCLYALWLIIAGLLQLMVVRNSNESLMTTNTDVRGVGLLVTAVILGLLGIYNLKFSNKLNLIKKNGQINDLWDAFSPLMIIYKIQVVVIYVLLFMVIPAFLLWGINSLLRK